MYDFSFIFRLFERGVVFTMSSEKPVYIHYGHDKFRVPDPIKNIRFFTKPKGGLWASRKDDEDGWKNWCEREEFHLDLLDRSFEFTLKDSANVLVLNDREQLDYLPGLNYDGYFYNKYEWTSECYLDFEKLSKEYDAIELANINYFYWALYGWDCNSILIMNPDIVEVIEQEGGIK